MIVKEQKTISFNNTCKAQFKYEDLSNAILWYSDKPVVAVKTIYMYGRYPAISIYDKKIHIHRLLMMYYLQHDLESSDYVHHKDDDVFNALKHNLEIQHSSIHQSLANKGRKQTSEHVAKRIDATTKTRYGHSIYENPELTKED